MIYDRNRLNELLAELAPGSPNHSYASYIARTLCLSFEVRGLCARCGFHHYDALLTLYTPVITFGRAHRVFL